MTQPDLIVVGAGLVGRLLAWRAAREGARVSLYDAGPAEGTNAAAWVAAGMVAPGAEAVDTSSAIVEMGFKSLKLWPQWLQDLRGPVFYRSSGSLLMWPPDEAAEAERICGRLRLRVPELCVEAFGAERLHQLEPEADFALDRGLYLTDDAQIDSRELLTALHCGLQDEHVDCHWNTPYTPDTVTRGPLVADCRGLGTKQRIPKLRGVRGEILRVHCPALRLERMVRLIHSRYPCYVAPRANGRFVIGATTIESEDRSEVSVRGTVELLLAACSVLPALGEARILEMSTQLRPALPDNQPILEVDPETRVLTINGLYRHGFLLSPVLVQQALEALRLSSLTPPRHSYDTDSLYLHQR